MTQQVTTQQFDVTDVPTVSVAAMEAMVDLVVSRGRAGCFFSGHDAELRASVENDFWSSFAGTTGEGVAILVRFWALVDTMPARRVSKLLFNEGFAILKPLAAAAASIRLNASWGFPPQRLLWAVADARARQSVAGARRSVRIGRPIGQPPVGISLAA